MASGETTRKRKIMTSNQLIHEEITRLETDLHNRKKSWWRWHNENPVVWELFQYYAHQAISAGKGVYSQWAIINRIRWNREVETSGDEFKISNDYIAFYARYFIHVFPQHKDFFVVKPLKEEKLIDRLKERLSPGDNVVPFKKVEG